MDHIGSRGKRAEGPSGLLCPCLNYVCLWRDVNLPPQNPPLVASTRPCFPVHSAAIKHPFPNSWSGNLCPTSHICHPHWRMTQMDVPVDLRMGLGMLRWQKPARCLTELCSYEYFVNQNISRFEVFSPKKLCLLTLGKANIPFTALSAAQLPVVSGMLGWMLLDARLWAGMRCFTHTCSSPPSPTPRHWNNHTCTILHVFWKFSINTTQTCSY